MDFPDGQQGEAIDTSPGQQLVSTFSSEHPTEIKEFVAKNKPDSEEKPALSWREFVGVGLMVALCDLTIYHAKGFAAAACLFAAAPIILSFSAPRRRWRHHGWFVAAMTALLSLRLLWAGSVAMVVYGAAVTVAFAMTLSGMRPFLLEGFATAVMTTLSGLDGLIHYVRSGSRPRVSVPRTRWMNIGLPLFAGISFGIIFILANPDLSIAFGEHLNWVFSNLHTLLIEAVPNPGRLVFWCAALWITVGLLRPVISTQLTEDSPEDVVLGKDSRVAVHYEAFRNTLITLIGLFGIYLVFEFSTLWFREIPVGFYYAGYAHEGAGWLTAALALASVTLSAVFRGDVLADSRLRMLNRLAWIWAIQNLLLALAVYNRLWIYVGFNGMTQLRVFGFFGVTTVVVGFIVVLYKIRKSRNFLWLVRRDLWTAFVACFLFLITPVDQIVVSYNVRRVMAGDPAACMQIGVKKTDTEALALLLPLLDCDDPEIRQGVTALLAKRHKQLKSLVETQQQLGWTAFQWADHSMLAQLEPHADRWTQFDDKDKQQQALARFYDYAYQWY
ncbi:MAG: hypothetical protein CMJ78_18055 [Planctomycetaceae bacterium]|nr:hypothetical protein [Planctomycetaceae bacterium]